MFHLLAYSENFGAAAAANDQIDGVTDPVFTQRSNAFWLSKSYDILFAAAFSADLDDSRLEAPSLRLPTFPYINVNESILPPSPLNLTDYRSRPFRLERNEELKLVASDAANPAGRITGFIGIADSHVPAPQGNIVRLRGTSTTAATANAWSNIAEITWTNDLPHGEYALVGMEHFSSNAQAARAIFTSPSNQIMRPGCVSITALGNLTHPIFRNGNLGQWGRFTADDVPQVEVLCNAADAAHTVYLDLIKLR